MKIKKGDVICSYRRYGIVEKIELQGSDILYVCERCRKFGMPIKTSRRGTELILGSMITSINNVPVLDSKNKMKTIVTKKYERRNLERHS